MNNLNCKMQAHIRVCEENKLEELEKENDAYIETSLRLQIRV